MNLREKFFAIGLSFYSSALYQRVRHQWQGLAFSYMFLLVCLIVTPLIITLLVAMDKILYHHGDEPAIHRIIYEVADQLPPLYFEDYQLQVDEENNGRIITILFEGTMLPLARVDTQLPIEQFENDTTFMLIAKDGLHYRQNNGELRFKSWSDMLDTGDFTLNHSSIREAANAAVDWLDDNKFMLYVAFGVVFWSFTVLAFYLYRIIEALLIGLAGKGIAMMFHQRIPYEQSVRLAVMAMTPAIVLDVFFLSVGLGGISFLMFIAISLCYLAYAIKVSG